MAGVSALLVLSLGAFAGGPSMRATAAPARVPAASSSGAVGVSPKSLKVGIALVDYGCVKQFVDSIRVNEQQVYQAYISDINAKGGIAGRKIVPVYDSYCPLGSAGALAVCTKLTDDDKVFAVIGTFVDFSGDAQTCVAKQHHRVLLAFSLTQAIMSQSPPGLIVYPGATNERTVKVLLALLARKQALKGKKVAVLGGSAEAGTVNTTIVPGLRKRKVPLGTTAILSINGTADTTAAQSQLDSFIEKWKGEHVNAIFLSGDEVSSKQFVTKIRHEMPKVMLVTDTTNVLDFAKEEAQAGVKPNPYEGIISTGGPPSKVYDKSANYRYCAAIYQRYTKKKAPKSTTVIKGPGGKTIDTYGAISDACQIRLDVPRHRGEGRPVTERCQLGQDGRPLRRDREPGIGSVLVVAHGQVRRAGQLPARGVRLDHQAERRLESDHPGGERQRPVAPRPGTSFTSPCAGSDVRRVQGSLPMYKVIVVGTDGCGDGWCRRASRRGPREVDRCHVAHRACAPAPVGDPGRNGRDCRRDDCGHGGGQRGHCGEQRSDLRTGRGGCEAIGSER